MAASRRSSSVFMFSGDESSGGLNTHRMTMPSFEPKHLVVDLDGNNNLNNGPSLKLERRPMMSSNDFDSDEFFKGVGGSGGSAFMFHPSTTSSSSVAHPSHLAAANSPAVGYCVDSVEPKCSELKRLIDEFKVGYLNKLNRFKNNKIILQRLNNVIIFQYGVLLISYANF